MNDLSDGYQRSLVTMSVLSLADRKFYADELAFGLREAIVRHSDLEFLNSCGDVEPGWCSLHVVHGPARTPEAEELLGRLRARLKRESESGKRWAMFEEQADYTHLRVGPPRARRVVARLARAARRINRDWEIYQGGV